MDWMDALKLIVPLATAVLMVWIKAAIEGRMLTLNKRHVLSRLISEEVGDLPNVMNALRRIAESASNGKLRLVSVNVSALVGKLSSDLSELDPKHAYFYSDLVSAIGVTNMGLARLFSLIEKRASADNENVARQLDRAIIGQSRILASDFVSFASSSLNVLSVIPENRRYQDAQGFRALQDAISNAEALLESWPTSSV